MGLNSVRLRLTVQRDQGHNWIGIDANATGRDSQIFFPKKILGERLFLVQDNSRRTKNASGTGLENVPFFLVPVTTSHLLDLLGCLSYSRL